MSAGQNLEGRSTREGEWAFSAFAHFWAARGQCASLVLFGALAACSPPGQASTPAVKSEQAARAAVVPFEELTQLGLPGGSELCFNAWDDNQNGLIDEGCGVTQSQLQVMIAWQEPQADFDLFVTDPGGEIAEYGRATEAGMTLSADCPTKGGECSVQPFEVVTQEASELSSGRYQVRVRLEQLPPSPPPFELKLGVRTALFTKAYRAEFRQVGQEAHLSFLVPPSKDEKKE